MRRMSFVYLIIIIIAACVLEIVFKQILNFYKQRPANKAPMLY